MDEQRDRFDEIARRIADELRSEAEHEAQQPRLRARVRAYARHEAVRIGHEVGLATAGVLVADHYVVPLIFHVAPMLLG